MIVKIQFRNPLIAAIFHASFLDLVNQEHSMRQLSGVIAGATQITDKNAVTIAIVPCNPVARYFALKLGSKLRPLKGKLVKPNTMDRLYMAACLKKIEADDLRGLHEVEIPDLMNS